MSTVKVIATNKQSGKILITASEIVSAIDGFNDQDYQLKKKTWFGLSTKSVLDRKAARKHNTAFVIARCRPFSDESMGWLETTDMGERVLKINNLLLSGNELQLTAEDSKAFDLVCGGGE
tara:strand:- start:54204 stop:54563 length:360 start_codon:yes stop_codon:yes gene_type:complete